MVSLSSEVSPQMREYERFNTTIANAYIKPLMASYLGRLRDRLAEAGADCPVFLMHSGGGIMSLESAAEFPVRLVESGPAGGAIFAADIAARHGLDQGAELRHGRDHGEDLPDQGPDPEDRPRVRGGAVLPVQEGLGHADLDPGDRHGGDRRGRRVAGACRRDEPDPRGAGERRLRTGARLLRARRRAARRDRCRPDPGQARPGISRAGRSPDPPDASEAALRRMSATRWHVGEEAAWGVAEVVDENMANAARVHAVENGEDLSDYTMIAFGGAAPLHAARLCEKLGIDRCLVPQGAGVGSAIGFLRAPFSFEATGRSSCG
jgi:N-methylhydantoinase A